MSSSSSKSISIGDRFDCPTVRNYCYQHYGCRYSFGRYNGRDCGSNCNKKRTLIEKLVERQRELRHQSSDEKLSDSERELREFLDQSSDEKMAERHLGHSSEEKSFYPERDLNDQSSDEGLVQPGRDLTEESSDTQQDEDSNQNLEP